MILLCREFARGETHLLKEKTISTDKTLSWSYAEELAVEDDALLAARARGSELGAPAITPAAGATLSVLAAATGARTVVEVGTGTAVTSLYLLRGMALDGVLTTIDLESEHQRAAKAAFSDARVPAGRTRAISGRPLDVLPRLTDSAYDLVILGGEPTYFADYAAQAQRLLRTGGLLIITEVLWHGAVADPARRDDVPVSLRELIKSIKADEKFLTAVLPVGGGLLVAAKR